MMSLFPRVMTALKSRPTFESSFFFTHCFEVPERVAQCA
jgi:hypothetical protein